MVSSMRSYARVGVKVSADTVPGKRLGIWRY
jgi:hypothetical protein